ncbi:hypothetical protein PF007_g25615 [Phytophthora fragariae]|uniref:Pectate lyase n=1 Tax=Phytophthora fragariae TaxID=53985 RepID=A0A6A3QCU0_9STRA|nr:hypothetical protein PF007_g25615 [Phytophthora fragariae]
MQIWTSLVALVGLVATAEGACSGPNVRITPPTGAIVVDASGAHVGSVRTVAEGFAKLPNQGLRIWHLYLCTINNDQKYLPSLTDNL